MDAVWGLIKKTEGMADHPFSPGSDEALLYNVLLVELLIRFCQGKDSGDQTKDRSETQGAPVYQNIDKTGI